MDCTQFDELLTIYMMDGKVSDDIKDEFEHHAFSCDECWPRFEKIQQFLLACDIDAYKKAKDPVKYYLDLAEYLEERGDYEEAAKLVKRALDDKPDVVLTEKPSLIQKVKDLTAKARKVIQDQIDALGIKSSVTFYETSAAKGLAFGLKPSNADAKIDDTSKTEVLVNGGHATFSESHGIVIVKLKADKIDDDLMIEVIIEKKVVFKEDIPIRFLMKYKDQYVAEQKESQPTDSKTDSYDVILEADTYSVWMDNIGKIEIGIPLQ